MDVTLSTYLLSHGGYFIGIVDGLVCPSRKQSDPSSASPIPVKRVSYRPFSSNTEMTQAFT